MKVPVTQACRPVSDLPYADYGDDGKEELHVSRKFLDRCIWIDSVSLWGQTPVVEVSIAASEYMDQGSLFMNI